MKEPIPPGSCKSAPKLDRELTDESLGRERRNTDEALAAKRKLTQDLADEVVERARERADAVLDLAREKADEQLDRLRPGKSIGSAVARERGAEDGALIEERASADDSLRWEREEQDRTLAALLPFEREKTDRYLLTERMRSDEAVAHRDDFMGMVSHDLRNLLAGIATNAKLTAILAADAADGSQTVARMDRIERYVARMNRLIGDLVDVASVDAGKLAVHPRPGNAAELLEEAIAPYAQLAEDQGISLVCASRGQRLHAAFDTERMLQVLSNLIANALRYTPRGGAITLQARQVGDCIRISVLDTGEGIPENLEEAIFERFGQAAGNDHGGLGLGLYISRCIVNAQGGRIWAESNPADSGSAFHFTIPVAAPAG